MTTEHDAWLDMQNRPAVWHLGLCTLLFWMQGEITPAVYTSMRSSILKQLGDRLYFDSNDERREFLDRMIDATKLV